MTPITIPLPDGGTVEVDGSTVPSIDELGVGVDAAVVFRMPAHQAHTLAHTIATWSNVGELLGATAHSCPSEDRQLARALHRAAAATGLSESTHCATTHDLEAEHHQ